MTQPWPGNQRRTAPDCLCLLGPGRWGTHRSASPGCWPGHTGSAQPGLQLFQEKKPEEKVWAMGTPPPCTPAPRAPASRWAKQHLVQKKTQKRTWGSSLDLHVSLVLVRNESTINYFCLLPSSKNGLLRVSPVPTSSSLYKVVCSVLQTIVQDGNPTWAVSRAKAASQPG